MPVCEIDSVLQEWFFDDVLEIVKVMLQLNNQEMRQLYHSRNDYGAYY
jgi:hypothetical protein